MDQIEALVVMTTASVGVALPVAAIPAGGVHLGGGAVPYVPPPVAAIRAGGVHFGGVTPYVPPPPAPPPPVPPPPTPIPTHAVPDDGTMIGITAEVSLILFSVISDLFICRIRIWWHT